MTDRPKRTRIRWLGKGRVVIDVNEDWCSLQTQTVIWAFLTLIVDLLLVGITIHYAGWIGMIVITIVGGLRHVAHAGKPISEEETAKRVTEFQTT